VASQGVSLDNANWSPSQTVSADGSYTAYWTATDNAGNSASTSQAFQIDQTPPTLSVDVPPVGTSGWYTSTPVVLKATASDALSGLASLQYAIDGAWQSGDTASLTADGKHTVQFKATDKAGNVTPSSNNIWIDTTPPVFAPGFSGTLGKNSWYTSAVTVSAGASDATSGVASVNYSLDGGGTWNAGSSVKFSTNGTYTVIFQALDGAANSSNSATLSVKVDLTDPTFTPGFSGTLGTNGWYTSAVTVNAGESDSVSGIDPSSVESWADGGPWQAGDSVNFSADGAHSVIFQADDNAGNEAQSSLQNLKIDTQPPHSSFLSPAEGTTVVASGDITLSGQVTDDTSGVSSAELSLDGGTTWLPLSLDSTGRWSYGWTVNSLSRGSYTAEVRSTDLAGNSEQAAHIRVDVDNDAPHVTITPNFFVWYTAQIGIHAAAVPVTGASITVSDPLKRHPNRVIQFDGDHLPTSFLWDHQMGDENTAPIGIYSVTVAAWDNYGHTGRASGLVILPAAVGPVLPTSAPAGAFALPPTRTPLPTPTETATPIPTATVTLWPSPTLTATRAVSVVVIGNSPQTPNPSGIPIPAPTDNVLFGAAAVTAAAAVMAVVLDDQRKRQQLLDEENEQAKERAAHLQAQEDAYLAGQAAQAKAQAKYQAALYGQYEAQQQELDAEAAQAAARNTLPSDVVAVMSGTIYNDPETDDTETKDTDTNPAQAFREADDASMATVATAVPVAAANTQPKTSDQNEPWWDKAIDFVDHNQVAASAVIGLGVGLGAVAIIATGGLATPLVIGGAALIAAGLTVGGTVALNAHYDRPPDQNLIRNVGVAATAAIVAGVAPEFFAAGQAVVATAVTNATMVAYASGASLAGAALSAAAPVAGAAASVWALGSVGAIGYGLSTSADPTLSPEENQMGSVIGAEGTQSLEAVTDISNLADMANELSPFNQIVTEYDDTDPANALGAWSSTNLKNNGVALALRSGSDADAIQATQDFLKLDDFDSPEANELIPIMAGNSLVGSGDTFYIGQAAYLSDKQIDYNGGFIGDARANAGMFYTTNPGVSQLLDENIADPIVRDEIYMRINQAAIKTAIADDMNFDYSLNGVNDPDVERAGIDAVEKNNMDAVKKLFKGSIPFRMAEVKALFDAGYTYSLDLATNTVHFTKP
jgi:hypothetical protein